MSDDSRRSRKRAADAGARALRKRAGWDPHSFRSTTAEEKLAALVHEERTSSAYDGADRCEACEAERAETGDETALCEPHLMAAMGLG